MTSRDEGMPVMLLYTMSLVSSIRTLVLFDGWMNKWMVFMHRRTDPKMESELMADNTEV